MVAASASYPLIREFSTAHERYVPVRRMLRFGNTNSLVRSPEWTISVSKTGYISEAGRCLVMQTWLHQQPVVMVLMDSSGRYTRTADAKRAQVARTDRSPAPGGHRRARAAELPDYAGRTTRGRPVGQARVAFNLIERTAAAGAASAPVAGAPWRPRLQGG